jgi:hypothetical protein
MVLGLHVMFQIMFILIWYWPIEYTWNLDLSLSQAASISVYLLYHIIMDRSSPNCLYTSILTNQF